MFLGSPVRCVCASIKPGSTVALGRLIVVAPDVAWLPGAGPTLTTLSPSITIAWLSRVFPVLTSRRWPARSRTRLSGSCVDALPAAVWLKPRLASAMIIAVIVTKDPLTLLFIVSPPQSFSR